MRSLKVAGAAVLLLTSVSARAFVREETDKTQLCLYWGTRQVPFTINEGGTREAGCTADQAIAAVRAGFSAWPAATKSGATVPCTDFQFSYQGTTSRIDTGYTQGASNNINLVVWRQGICTQDITDPCHNNNTCGNTKNCWDHGTAGTIALTTTTYVVGTGEIKDADMEFFDWDGRNSGAAIMTANQNGWYFTCFGQSTPVCQNWGDSGCTYIDLQNTATHEAGHIVGLDHEPVNEAVATMNATAYPGELTKRILADDDVNGICTIYPKGGATSVCYSTTSASGGCGYGTGLGGLVGVLVSLMAGVGLRLRRARRA